MKAPRISIELKPHHCIIDDLNQYGMDFAPMIARAQLRRLDSNNTWMKLQHNVMVF